jgi:ABC-type sugar transport system permease subunit
MAGELARREARTGLFFVLPVLALFALVNTTPVVISFVYSLTDFTLGSKAKFVGLANYQSLLSDSEFLKALVVTLKMGLGLALPGSLLAFLVALSISKGSKTGVFSTILFIPVIYPSVVSAFIWGATLKGDGLINRYLGLENDWLNSVSTALPSLILVLLWTNIGFYIVIVLTGLRGVSPSLYEAASLDGANEWHKLRWITFPLMKPVILFIGIIATSDALQIFTQPYLLTGGGPVESTKVLAGLIYEVLFERLEIARASSIAVSLALISTLIAVIQYFLVRSKR